jgi:hypothetical protein
LCDTDQAPSKPIVPEISTVEFCTDRPHRERLHPLLRSFSGSFFNKNVIDPQPTWARRPENAADTVSAVKEIAEGDVRPRPRAKQSIPPALRRAVLTRDQRRCRVPGCTHATFVDVHHVQPRAEGGRNDASNLLTLCSAHHRATHRGELLIEREHDEASSYGTPMEPPTATR